MSTREDDLMAIVESVATPMQLKILGLMKERDMHRCGACGTEYPTDVIHRCVDKDFESYGKEAHATAFYAESITGVMPAIVYAALGLGGEAGEVLEKVKKLYRDQGGKLDAMERERLMKELGDVLWYLNEIAIMAGSSLGEVAALNLAKLRQRRRTGTLAGSGDDR